MKCFSLRIWMAVAAFLLYAASPLFAAIGSDISSTTPVISSASNAGGAAGGSGGGMPGPDEGDQGNGQDSQQNKQEEEKKNQ